LDGIYDARFRLAPDTFLTKRLPDDEVYGAYRHIMAFNASGHFGKYRELTPSLFPLLYPSDADAEMLGVYLDSDLPAFVRKKCEGFTSYLCSIKCLSADIVREVAREVGCHIYSENEDVFYVGPRFLTHHASHGGKKTIRLPRPARITDAYTDALLEECTDTITFIARRGDTHTLRLEFCDQMPDIAE
jgi:hypothetical protein